MAKLFLKKNLAVRIIGEDKYHLVIEEYTSTVSSKTSFKTSCRKMVDYILTDGKVVAKVCSIDSIYDGKDICEKCLGPMIAVDDL